jgi:cytochrome c-type biogenesis protein CcmH/NrfG
MADANEALLSEARRDLDGGQPAAAAVKYSTLAKKGHRLDTIIRELQETLYRFPVDIDVWQTLGDAYLRNDNLQEALDAYTKAEELLR